LSRAGFDGAFQVVRGGDEGSRPKPEPEVYLEACRFMRADPLRSVALEDSPPGATAARAAGMYVIGVPSEPGIELGADPVADSLAHPDVQAFFWV
jgi:beta-phosphoglucomutase-like phosphatase (HAD superfamily)